MEIGINKFGHIGRVTDGDIEIERDANRVRDRVEDMAVVVAHKKMTP